MKTFFQVLFLLPILVLIPNGPLYAQNALKNKVVSKEVFANKDGDEFEINLVSYLNQNDELEVRLEAGGIPRLMEKISPVIGYGRDINDNGIIDTWFFITEEGIELVKKEGKENLGRDILGEILKKKYASSLRMYVQSATTSVLSYLFISAHEGISIQEEFYQQWMDLEESKLLFEEDMANLSTTFTYDQIQYFNKLQSLGYADLIDKMDRFAKVKFWQYSAADVGIWVSGGIIIKWGAKIVQKIGNKASETAFAKKVEKNLSKFYTKQKALLAAKVALVQEQLHAAKIEMGMTSAKKQMAVALTVATVKMTVRKTLKSQKTKRRLLKYVAKTIKWPKKVYRGAKSEWKYIALNSSVQIGSEAFARYDEIYDENPLVMAQNLATNPDVIQNVSFMTTETIMMTGVSRSLKTTKARFMASGAIAVTNSSIVNFALIDEEANLGRVAFDTAWESIIGNAQVQFDLISLEYFEKMALKKNNPKIKLLGYAVAFIDMAAGYVAYSEIATAIEKPEELKLMLIPILAKE